MLLLFARNSLIWDTSTLFYLLWILTQVPTKYPISIAAFYDWQSSNYMLDSNPCLTPLHLCCYLTRLHLQYFRNSIGIVNTELVSRFLKVRWYFMVQVATIKLIPSQIPIQKQFKKRCISVHVWLTDQVQRNIQFSELYLCS